MRLAHGRRGFFGIRFRRPLYDDLTGWVEMPHLQSVVFLASLAKHFRDPRFIEDRGTKYRKCDRGDDKRVVGRECGLMSQQGNRISEVHR